MRNQQTETKYRQLINNACKIKTEARQRQAAVERDSKRFNTAQSQISHHSGGLAGVLAGRRAEMSTDYAPSTPGRMSTSSDGRDQTTVAPQTTPTRPNRTGATISETDEPRLTPAPIPQESPSLGQSTSYRCPSRKDGDFVPSSMPAV